MALSDRQRQAAELAAAKDALRAAMKVVPRAVLDGGYVRARAWKAAAEKAGKLLRGGSDRTAAYEQALRELTAVESARDPAELWAAEHAARRGSK